ncbi:hypothetical protein TRAPUB_2539 [Trametes pubescens]|uniref:Uncharacterized protein n=1 Tax=Trametes pubescens TaxID=154538 RepID=A0A1M2VG94_TRAPU|nr:hypothetical protein TRAPUB_2539 [Trametes pubescens]
MASAARMQLSQHARQRHDKSAVPTAHHAGISPDKYSRRLPSEALLIRNPGGTPLLRIFDWNTHRANQQQRGGSEARVWRMLKFA